MAPLPMIPVATSAAALHAAYETRAAAAAPGSEHDWRRDHLGASLIGHPCDRYLWLSFRWALNPHHKGKLLRLFERGHREEAWIVEDLRAAGFAVQDRDPATGEQFRVTWHGGHFGGGLDGMVSGLLEAPKTTHVLEVKTHNLKSFEKLQKDGVKRSKPQHYAQMQTYMRGRGLERAYYVAVCKDNDELYTERVHLEPAYADELIARARQIIDAPEPPARKPEPDYPPCLYTTAEGVQHPCQYRDLCFGDGVMPERNCRTCIDATPAPGGTWRCAKFECEIPKENQRFGCQEQLTIPSIVNMQVASVDEHGRRITYQAADGRTFVEAPRGGAA